MMPPVRRFAYRLALALGEPNPDVMLARMPSHVWQEWQRYATLEPWDEVRADWRAAMIAWTMANLWGREKGRPAFTIDQFMPQFNVEPPKPKSPDDMLEIIMNYQRMIGAPIIDLREDGDHADPS